MVFVVRLIHVVPRFKSLLVILCLSFVSGCIVLPIESGEEELFVEQQITFIETGKSTKDDVAREMSEIATKHEYTQPRPIKARDGDWWLYRQTRREVKWLGASVYPEVSYDTTNSVDYRFLLINFDSNGIVSGYEFSTLEGSGCNRQGVCLKGNSYLLLAPKDDDRVAKQFNNPGERCGVYLYGDQRHGERFKLDDQLEGSLLEKRKFFFFWSLKQGRHRLSAIGATPIEFLCTAGELYFFEVERVGGSLFRMSYKNEIVSQESAIGRREIGKRKLALSFAISSD